MTDHLIVFDSDPREESDGEALKVAARARFIASYVVSEGWKAGTDATGEDLSQDAVTLLAEQLNWHMAEDDGEIPRIEDFLVDPDVDRHAPDPPVIAVALWRLASWRRTDPTRSNHHAEQMAHTLLTRRFIRMADDEQESVDRFFDLAVTSSR